MYFKLSKKVDVRVEDAAEFVSNWSGEKFDAILVDVNAEDPKDAMLSPSVPFRKVREARKSEA